MTSPEASVAPRPARKRPATSIERAAYAPDLRAPLRPPESVAAAVPGGAIVLLVHDGRESAVREALQRGMERAVTTAPLLLAIHVQPPDESAAMFAQVLEHHRPEAVVLTPPLGGRSDLVDVCDRARTRCLRIGLAPELSCDERAATALTVRRLVTLGHARIGLVAGPETSPGARQRELGYLDAMAEHGLDRGPALIVPGDDTFESGMAAGRLLLEISPRPTAILACNDDMAAGVLHAAAQAGVPVPEALSLVGFDDTSIARRLLPPLASVRIPWERIGHEAINRILNRSAAPPGPFDAQLVERASLAVLT